MGIFLWIVLGLAAGLLARYVMPGPDPWGILGTIVLGIAGAVLGGWVSSLVGAGTITGFDIRSFCMAVLGSLGLLMAYRTFAMRGPA